MNAFASRPNKRKRATDELDDGPRPPSYQPHLYLPPLYDLHGPVDLPGLPPLCSVQATPLTEPPLLISDQDSHLIDFPNGPPVTRGGFCEIYKAVYRPKNIKLAMKRLLSDFPDDDALRQFRREADVWSTFKHINILPFFGTMTFNDRLYLTSPWMELGDLLAFVGTRVKLIEKGESLFDMPIYLRFHEERIVWEIAAGLEYLHSINVVHGDVKAKNVLLTDEGCAQLCDFGLTKTPEYSATSTGLKGVGSARWQSPELLEDNPKSAKSDIYAFGMTISEILTGKYPFHHIKTVPAIVLAVMVREERPDCQPSSRLGANFQLLWRLAARCWSLKPEDRPSITEIMKQSGRMQPRTICPSQAIYPQVMPQQVQQQAMVQKLQLVQHCQAMPHQVQQQAMPHQVQQQQAMPQQLQQQAMLQQQQLVQHQATPHQVRQQAMPHQVQQQQAMPHQVQQQTMPQQVQLAMQRQWRGYSPGLAGSARVPASPASYQTHLLASYVSSSSMDSPMWYARPIGARIHSVGTNSSSPSDKSFRRRTFQNTVGGKSGIAWVGHRWSLKLTVTGWWEIIAVEFSSPHLPSWLTWNENVLSGVPDLDGPVTEITVDAKLILVGAEGVVQTTFSLRVATPAVDCTVFDKHVASEHVEVRFSTSPWILDEFPKITIELLVLSDQPFSRQLTSDTEAILAEKAQVMRILAIAAREVVQPRPWYTGVPRTVDAQRVLIRAAEAIAHETEMDLMEAQEVVRSSRLTAIAMRVVDSARQIQVRLAGETAKQNMSGSLGPPTTISFHATSAFLGSAVVHALGTSVDSSTDLEIMMAADKRIQQILEPTSHPSTPLPPAPEATSHPTGVLPLPRLAMSPTT